MYHATVYRLMIAAPSDIKEEITTAFDVINHWNDMHSEQSKLVLLPLHWSISSYPAMGKHPQKLLNEQFVVKSDLLICVFGTRLGTPTDTEISGTVEEINEHRKAGKDVMMFFKRNVGDINSVDIAQFQQLKEFKDRVKNNGLWCEFDDANDFKQVLSEKLQLYINKNWNDNNVEKETRLLEQNTFSSDEEQILSNWVNSRNGSCYTIGVLGGVKYVFGDFQYLVAHGKDEALWEDFIERLQNIGFVDFEKYDNSGKPVYKLKKAAYDYVDNLSNN